MKAFSLRGVRHMQYRLTDYGNPEMARGWSANMEALGLGAALGLLAWPPVCYTFASDAGCADSLGTVLATN